MTDQHDAGQWFPFYPGDFARDTMHLTAEETGVYLRLLCHQWVKGSIPEDPARLQRITQANQETIDLVVEEYFPGHRNRRLEEERSRALEKREKARQSALKRWGTDQEDTPGHQEDQDANALRPQSEGTSERNASTTTTTTTSRKPATSSSHSSRPAKLVSDEMWERFKAIYPDRNGNQYWAKARDKAEQLLRAGVDWADIMAGARRYRAQLEATGRIGTEFVKQAQFWLTPKEQLWTEEYPIPGVQPGKRQASITSAVEWANQGDHDDTR
jgi:uncharacterized protein YdaU (DUF1376 family)